MEAQRARSSPMLAGVPLWAVFSGLIIVVSARPSDADPRPQEETLGVSSCADDCNRKAADCLDVCEEKFKSDDKARVTCKFECATKRQQCEKDCN
jgi:hypothetical protein